ncbi:MAG TPA: YicC/YloC family endoribonuclease [Polyangiaceae bacterium]|nr:YicC/YloC family endoribonuclease [Polyangiaceae bacterium]
MRSMTGFGVGDAPLAEGRLTLELRALNHRFLEVRVRLPNEISEHSFFVEQLARERLSRGRFEVGVRLTGSALPTARFSLDRARALYQGLRELATELAPGSELPVSVITQLPELLLEPTPADSETMRQALDQAFASAQAHLDEMREREGAALERELRMRLRLLRELSVSVAELSSQMIEVWRARLRERIERLMPAGLAVDVPRLETEIVLLADRSDVTEELARLASHCDQFELLFSASEPIGRRLEFLLQEMARETNTIGSKSQDAKLAHLVVAMKAEIERIREQVQNVE